ncbi:hypothetical protein HCN44_002089 [Aphidius gifuensis]|uniref:Nuclear receptor domain-containing protein n=1 Tax=Aphidius gifuensis TaxID=684658 RepID=A0A834Y464_APHGI|nr:knirps-related protein-like [Aphidius gifuensis]KAF7996457.1 hypothetical protein HCN44_002089 [Aphidius gifuensis]
MNQQCKVCGEPAAGFHFGAFTCEGCKSFFGRSYNNVTSISECKNGGECVINKKNRTACKACRLKKCLVVGMSKSGSRYGRRSNWFKIHCLLQEQQQQQQQHHQQQHHHHHQQQQHQQQQHQQQQHQHQQQQQQQQQTISSHHLKTHGNNTSNSPMRIHRNSRNKDESMILGIDDYKNSTPPSISSPESHNSDSSVEISERRGIYGLHPGYRPIHSELGGIPLGFLSGMSLLPPSFMPPPSLSMFPPYHLYAQQQNHSNIIPCPPSMLSTSPIGSSNTTTTKKLSFNEFTLNNNNNNNNNNNKYRKNRNDLMDVIDGDDDDDNGENDDDDDDDAVTNDKRYYLDTVLKRQRTSESHSPISRNSNSISPISLLDNDCTPPQDNPIDLSMKQNNQLTIGSDDSDVDIDVNDSDRDSPILKRRPIDLTIRL